MVLDFTLFSFKFYLILVNEIARDHFDVPSNERTDKLTTHKRSEEEIQIRTKWFELVSLLSIHSERFLWMIFLTFFYKRNDYL